LRDEWAVEVFHPDNLVNPPEIILDRIYRINKMGRWQTDFASGKISHCLQWQLSITIQQQSACSLLLVGIDPELPAK